MTARRPPAAGRRPPTAPGAAMSKSKKAKVDLTVGISSRALFDLRESHQVYEEKGLDAYREYQIEREGKPLDPGAAFEMVRKLLRLNESEQSAVEVVLMSRNSADTGLRVFNSIRHHELDIQRAAFSGGESVFPYIAPFGCQLFLSADEDDVCKALKSGIPAATIMHSENSADPPSEPESEGPLRIAFDGDAVLFSDESERVYREGGLSAFNRHETDASEPLEGGPFKPVLAALQRIQDEFSPNKAPIRTYLVTARGAPAHERVIKTLRAWDIRIDESLFLGGLDKKEILKSFNADIFFDDQIEHCESARDHVATGHVPHGVANEEPDGDGGGA